jgi:hypothetical protein
MQQPAAAAQAGPNQRNPTAQAKQRQQQPLARSARAAAAPNLTGRKTLKESKKEFLKKKKLKKRGRHLQRGNPDEGEGLEARLLQDLHKPKFGEQAMAPIKVSSQAPVLGGETRQVYPDLVLRQFCSHEITCLNARQPFCTNSI